MTATDDLRALAHRYSAHTYHPLPVVVSSARGAWVTDVEGRRYLDFLSAYSAMNFGHGNARLLAAARSQLERVTLVSRAFEHDNFGPFCRDLAELCGKDMVLPMNTGAEAVETALKAARKWGYRSKGVPHDQATVVVAAGNFHGRTITIVSFSTDETARADYGPFTPGFRVVPYGDLAAMEAAIDDTTVAVLVEPVQGEAGVVLPPAGYLAGLRQLCTREKVLLVADEIQSGLGRAGATFACDLAGVVPDLYVLGKALGGGLVPVSAVVGDADVLGLFRPGEHGSTFGGNPLACAIGREVVAMLRTGEPQERSRVLGEHLAVRLEELPHEVVADTRSVGLWAGIELRPERGRARQVSEAMCADGVLVKETHDYTVRVAPPLVIDRDDLDHGIDVLVRAVGALA
ncbi:MAG: ornithine--oxo-acid transaminase [Actinomycetota bacterium]